jgi:hypothetical protein
MFHAFFIMWCDHIVSGLNLFLIDNNNYPLISVVPLRLVFLEHNSVSTEILPLFKAGTEVHCFQLGSYCPQFCLNRYDVIKSLSL